MINRFNQNNIIPSLHAMNNPFANEPSMGRPDLHIRDPDDMWIVWEGHPRLHVAVYAGDLEKIQEYLSDGDDVNEVAYVRILSMSNKHHPGTLGGTVWPGPWHITSRCQFRATPLVTACGWHRPRHTNDAAQIESDRLDVVRKLLSDPRIDPTVKVTDPKMVADPAELQNALMFGPHALNKSALEVAVENGLTSIALELLQDDRIAAAANFVTLWTKVFLENIPCPTNAEVGLEMVQRYLALPGIDVNMRDDGFGYSNFTALHTAAWYTRPLRRSHPEQRAPYWQAVACISGLLAVPGIDVNPYDDFLRTPLYIACRRGNAVASRALLLDKRVCIYHNPGTKKFVKLEGDQEGEDAWREHEFTGGQPFTVAVWKWHEEVVELFLKRERARVLAERLMLKSVARQRIAQLDDDVVQTDVLQLIDQTLITQDLIDKLKADEDEGPRTPDLREKLRSRKSRLKKFIDDLQEDVKRLGVGKIREFTFPPDDEDEQQDEQAS